MTVANCDMLLRTRWITLTDSTNCCTRPFAAKMNEHVNTMIHKHVEVVRQRPNAG